MIEDKYNKIKKFTQFEAECKYFDFSLANLQELYNDRNDEHSRDIWARAQIARDVIYIILQKIRGASDADIKEGMMF